MFKPMFKKIGVKLAPAWQRFCLYLFDVIAFFSTLFFASYIILLIHWEIGDETLNYILFALSLLFALLYLVKIFYYNHKAEGAEATKNLKNKFKMTKYLLKIFMLVVLVVGIVSIFRDGNFFSNVVAAVTTIASNILFILFLWLDTYLMLRARRKAQTEEVKFVKKNY